MARRYFFDASFVERARVAAGVVEAFVDRIAHWVEGSLSTALSARLRLPKKRGMAIESRRAIIVRVTRSASSPVFGSTLVLLS